MRRLVRCDGCNRQYDASTRDPGERFHCHCQRVVTIPSGRPHDAAVVRCSSCGGARHDAEACCQFCGAQLTLHERDLHTLCPGCFARISDRARFCHHCGLGIRADEVVAQRSDRPCPACGPEQPLAHRAISESLAALECGKCAGLWVGQSDFGALVDDAREAAQGRVDPPVRRGASAPARSPQGGPMYRRCVACSQHMARRNFGRQSGVILDSCREHGVWFDAHELDAVLRWIASGGEQHVAKQERDAAERLIAKAKLAPIPAPQTPIATPEAAVDDLILRALRSFFSMLS